MGNEQSAQISRQKAETKVQNGDLNGHAVSPPDLTEPVASKVAEQQKTEISPVIDTKEPKPSPGKEEVDKAKRPETATSPDAEPPKQDLKPTGEEVNKFFGKMFKKKAELEKPASQNKDSVDGQSKGVEEQQSEPVAIKASTEAEPVPKGAALELLEDLVDVAEDISQTEDVKEAEKTVMNFFKTFVSPTKASKEAKASPDASKDQKETPPAPLANEAPKAPPPPPPAPPKMEGKAEAAVKKEETSAAAAARAAEASAKTKPKDMNTAFSKLFRPKPVVVEETKPVEVQVDASKTSTLEAAAKPEEPPAAKPEGKKVEKKSSFGSLFKPKVLLGQVTTRIQAAAASAAVSISLVSPRSATEPKKKETPAAPAVAESAPIVKAKEEPKPAAPAAPVAPDNKSLDSTENASPSISRRLEKRNSIQLFFKNLGQKRHSDAGVQTDPVAPEKTK